MFHQFFKTMKTINLYKKAFAFCFSLFVFNGLVAQTTGSFDTNITFLSAQRQLSVYVPTDYNAANKYKLMVCLHGLGDNSINYRNALVNSLNWKSQQPNTIFVCPESSATTADYFYPEGSGNEAIITESIKYAFTNYNIDSADVVLQGFSLGGRAALRFGLNNPTQFKGLLLNTPAIQGVKEGTNKQPLYPFSFANAAQVPVYISHGDDDFLYTAPIDSAVEQLVLNDCPLFFTRIAGMGHTIPQQAQLGDFTKFFDSTTTANIGIEVLRVYSPIRTCDGKLTGGVLIRNIGKTPITSATLDISLPAAAPSRSSITGLNLAPYQHAILPFTNQAVGSNQTATVTFKVSTINNLINTDSFSLNNQNKTTKVIVGQTSGSALPFAEGFEGAFFPPSGWAENVSGDGYSGWAPDTDIKKTGTSAMGAFNTVLIFDNSFRVEDIQTPLLDLTSKANPHLTFDVCYNYHKFKSGNDSVSFADTLDILVSTDCGNTFTSVFRKGGADLATFATPILNPNTIEKCFAAPADSNWKKVLIPLDAFATSTSAIISFRYQSALGGSVTIDNVGVDNNTLSTQTPQANAVTMYPNPAKNSVQIHAENIIAVNIFDAGGKQCTINVMQQTSNGCTLNTEALSSGLYNVQIITKEYVQNQKLLIVN
jgi:predicted esterase